MPCHRPPDEGNRWSRMRARAQYRSSYLSLLFLRRRSRNAFFSSISCRMLELCIPRRKSTRAGRWYQGNWSYPSFNICARTSSSLSCLLTKADGIESTSFAIIRMRICFVRQMKNMLNVHFDLLGDKEKGYITCVRHSAHFVP